MAGIRPAVGLGATTQESKQRASMGCLMDLFEGEGADQRGWDRYYPPEFPGWYLHCRTDLLRQGCGWTRVESARCYPERW
jgi:hypothetical protein